MVALKKAGLQLRKKQRDYISRKTGTITPVLRGSEAPGPWSPGVHPSRVLGRCRLPAAFRNSGREGRGVLVLTNHDHDEERGQAPYVTVAAQRRGRVVSGAARAAVLGGTLLQLRPAARPGCSGVVWSGSVAQNKRAAPPATILNSCGRHAKSRNGHSPATGAGRVCALSNLIPFQTIIPDLAGF